MIDPDRIRGGLLGAAVGDALGMPVEGLSHQNVRTYYKGVKGLRGDEKREDLGSGQWTGRTQRLFALARALAETDEPRALAQRYGEELVALRPVARRWDPATRAAVERLAEQREEPSEETGPATVGAAVAAAPLGVWWADEAATREDLLALLAASLGVAHPQPEALAAAFGQAFAVRYLIERDPDALEGGAFLQGVTEATAWADDQLGVPGAGPAARLRTLQAHLGAFPLDLQDLCGGTGPAADEAWPFAVAMVARNPALLEATLLPAVNVGGDAASVGALVGALLGALHGWEAFPADWREGLEDREGLEAEATRLAEALADG